MVSDDGTADRSLRANQLGEEFLSLGEFHIGGEEGLSHQAGNPEQRSDDED